MSDASENVKMLTRNSETISKLKFYNVTSVDLQGIFWEYLKLFFEFKLLYIIPFWKNIRYKTTFTGCCTHLSIFKKKNPLKSIYWPNNGKNSNFSAKFSYFMVWTIRDFQN